MVPLAVIAGAMLSPGRCGPQSPDEGRMPGGTGGQGRSKPSAEKAPTQPVAGGFAGAIRSTYRTFVTVPLVVTLTSQLSRNAARGVPPGATALSYFATL